MKLIADSGSTKTDWALVTGGHSVEYVHTDGLNPIHMDAEKISSILTGQLLPAIDIVCKRRMEELEEPEYLEVTSVTFYGAGCMGQPAEMMREVLSDVFPSCRQVEVQTDLLASARALFGDGEGIACILGTGSNSGLYDGYGFTANTPPLGYILGDEGSGATLGKLFLGSLLKGLLPEGLKEEFYESMGMGYMDFINKVYREPGANRFLASLSPFIASHMDIPQVRSIVEDNFRNFVRRNLCQYGRRDLPVGAVGSIAWHYREILTKVLVEEGFAVGPIIKSPIDNL